MAWRWEMPTWASHNVCAHVVHLLRLCYALTLLQEPRQGSRGRESRGSGVAWPGPGWSGHWPAVALERELGTQHCGPVGWSWSREPSCCPGGGQQAWTTSKIQRSVWFSLLYGPLYHLSSYSYKRQIIRLGDRHPFWGARRIIKHYQEKMTKALSKRPPGARFQVLLMNPRPL
jgi:hypothetical protein